jgi:hypothetical protein
MHNILIIETVPKAVNPIDAHVRNALAIQTELKKLSFNVDILYINENSKRFQKKYDLVLVSYATQFPLIHELEKIEEINKDSIWGWLTNEYNLAPNGQFFKIFKKTSSFMLSNYELGAVKFSCFKRYYSVNLNTLLFDEKPVTLKTHDFIYYGTYRPNREQYFKKYFTNQVYLSTSTKNHKKFLHIGSKAKPIAKFGWKKPALLNFRYSLYIEDEFTHKHFNNLANRFYESLACHCVLLFDKTCANTLNQTQLVDYEQFLINGAEDLQRYNASNYQELLNIQKQWKNNVLFERNNTIKQISDIFTNEIKQLSEL